MLSFAPLRLSDAANYSCEVTISSNYLTTNIIAMASQSVATQSKLQEYLGDTVWLPGQAS